MRVMIGGLVSSLAGTLVVALALVVEAFRELYPQAPSDGGPTMLVAYVVLFGWPVALLVVGVTAVVFLRFFPSAGKLWMVLASTVVGTALLPLLFEILFGPLTLADAGALTGVGALAGVTAGLVFLPFASGRLRTSPSPVEGSKD